MLSCREQQLLIKNLFNFICTYMLFKMDMNSLRNKESTVKDEFDEIDDIYSYKDFSMDVRDTKPSFMDIDSKSHLMNKIETEDFTPEDSISENQIMGQSFCLSCENQWNTTKNNNISTPKSPNNDSGCILPYPCMCGPLLNSTVAEVEKINTIESSSSEIDLDPNFNRRFWNTEDINELDLNVILKDDMARAIYSRGVHDGSEVASKNEVNAVNELRRHTLTLIKNHILNRQKLRSELSKKNKKKLFKTPKSSVVESNDTFQRQFSIFDSLDASYLPLPAMQLMINTALSNENYKLCKAYNKNQVIEEDKNKSTKRNKLTKCFIKNPRTFQICKKNNHLNEFVHAMDNEIPISDEKITNLKNVKSTPIIPLSVLYYMDKLN